MSPPFIAVFLVGAILSHCSYQVNGSVGVCNTTAKYTYTSSQITVTSYTSSECCGWFCWDRCEVTNYRTTVTYYTVTENRTAFGCCSGYYQPNPGKLTCEASTCTDGQIKLVGGSRENEGIVEVCANRTWGTICDSSWSVQDATVACRQLGFSKYNARPARYRGLEAAPSIVWRNVICAGSEAKLADCRRSNNTAGCTHSSDAGVNCGNLLCRNGDIRLRGSSNPYEGIVEVCIDEEWGTVCGEMWDQMDAAVACRQLGLLRTASFKVSSSYYKKTDNHTAILSGMKCQGNETNLLECSQSPLGTCNSSMDAGINCQLCNDGEVRLAGGNTYQGRVELCTRGQWGRICREGWDATETTVVCRQLGLSTQDSGASNGSLYGSGVYPLLWTNPRCVGNESTLQECRLMGFWSFDGCGSSEVYCSPPYPGAPQSILANITNSTSIIVSWIPPPADQTYGNIHNYYLSCAPSSLTYYLPSNTTSQLVTGLSPYTTHICCVWALNSYDWGTSACVQVTTPPSALTQYPANFSASAVNSTCIILEWSPPILTQYNGPLLNYSIEIIPQMDTSQRSIFTTVQTVLAILSLHPFYNYTCTVAAFTGSGKGPSTPPITVTTLQDAPSGPPLQFRASAISSSSITMQWSPPAVANQNGIIIGYTVTITAMTTGQKQVLNTTNTSLTLNLLKPYTDYNCTVSSRTVAGSGPQATQLVQTNEEIPTGPPLNISHMTPNPTTLILSWNPPDPSLRNGVIRGYIVVITELETSKSSFFNTSTNPLSISSLRPFYTYNCSVAAYTVGLGPYSPPYMVKMPQSIPTSPPLNLSLVASTSTSITLSWAPPPTQYQNGVIIGYTLQLFNSQQSLLRETNTSSDTGTVDSLHPDTTYVVTVAAMTVVGIGPHSGKIYLVTRQFVPLIPPNVSDPVRFSADTIFLSWQSMPPNTIQGALTGYSVRYRPIVAVVKRDTNQGYTTISTTQTQITISSLDPTSAYMVGVAAVTQAGIGVYSESSVGLYENSLFQVYMQAPGIVCKEWMSYGTPEKIKDILTRISSDLGSAFPATYIGDTTLLCDKQHLNWVILTGRAVGTMKLNSSGMVYQLQEWVFSSPKVTSQGVVLQIMEYCPVHLTQLRSPSCSVVMATTTTGMQETKPSSIPVVGGTASNTELTSVASISGTIGGVLFLLVLVVAAMILYVRRKTRATFIVERVSGVNDVFKEMEFTKEPATQDPIYASINNLDATPQHSECLHSCGDPLPSTDDLLSRALPNPYASLPFVETAVDDYVDSVATEGLSHNDCTDPQIVPNFTDPQLVPNSNQMPLPLECDGYAQTAGCVPQEVLDDQATGSATTSSQADDSDTANGEYIRARTNQNSSGSGDTSDAVSLPAEEDYVEMK